MAQGDLVIFEEMLVYVGKGGANQIDFDLDTFNMALLTAAVTPTAADPVPAYSGGTTNHIDTEIAQAGAYTTGGAALANPTWTEAGGAGTFQIDDPATWSQNPSSPNAVKWALIYDDTTTIKHGIGFIDLGTTFDMTTGDLTVTIAPAGVFVATIGASV